MDYQLKLGEVCDALGVIKKHPVGTRTVDGVIVATCRAYQAPLPDGMRNIPTRPQVPQFTTAFHKISGPAKMHTVDANAAVQNHPDEWSLAPWAASAA